jgi:hypothetical protein
MHLSYIECLSSVSCNWGIFFPAIRGRYYLALSKGFEESMQNGGSFFSCSGWSKRLENCNNYFTASDTPNLPQVAETNPPRLMDAARERLLYDEFRKNYSNKEKYHVVHNHRNSNHPVVARLFRFEHKPKFPEDRQLDPHSDCTCRHSYRSESVRDHLASSHKRTAFSK